MNVAVNVLTPNLTGAVGISTVARLATSRSVVDVLTSHGESVRLAG